MLNLRNSIQWNFIIYIKIYFTNENAKMTYKIKIFLIFKYLKIFLFIINFKNRNMGDS
jgi:hypothetical protein